MNLQKLQFQSIISNLQKLQFQSIILNLRQLQWQSINFNQSFQIFKSFNDNHFDINQSLKWRRAEQVKPKDESALLGEVSNEESSLDIRPSKLASRDNFRAAKAISISPGCDTTNYFVESSCCVTIRTSSHENQILIQVGSVSEPWMAPFIRRAEASDNLKLTG